MMSFLKTDGKTSGNSCPQNPCASESDGNETDSRNQDGRELKPQEIDSLITRIKKYAKKSVVKARYEHSVRTAEMCAKLCSLYGLDENLGYLAGISHDICKNMSDEKLISLAEKDKNPVGELEMEKPSLLHGRAAAVLLEEEFDFHDKRILEAVANHTFGKPGMGDYAKVLFVADKVEPGRVYVDSEYLKNLFALPLNKAAKKVLKENIEYIEKKGKKISPESLKLADWLESLD